jgi:hypothetical protein
VISVAMPEDNRVREGAAEARDILKDLYEYALRLGTDEGKYIEGEVRKALAALEGGS